MDVDKELNDRLEAIKAEQLRLREEKKRVEADQKWNEKHHGEVLQRVVDDVARLVTFQDDDGNPVSGDRWVCERIEAHRAELREEFRVRMETARKSRQQG